MNTLKTTLLLVFAILSLQGFSQEKSKKMNVAVFIYDGVEILDFAGPAEVFSASAKRNKNGQWEQKFNVYTVAFSDQQITSQGFISISPNYSIANAPKPDIIVIPGGSSRASRENPKVISWIKENSKSTIFLTVCTGAFILAESGLLDNNHATTWYGAVESFKKRYPKVNVLSDVRFVDNGKIITTAGVSAGIDGSLHLVKKLIGIESARKTAQYMEYDKWDESAGRVFD
ncbi:DJ-1/PfpI family protein [Winogradskyella sp. 3972H.M.0a.05]|uniref:DJ-1/PfpI family protein n=1 Tax=Winogradskyella sp. 3972H.M.0a.05 TaxID=2950277 RepID=UPI00339AA380